MSCTLLPDSNYHWPVMTIAAWMIVLYLSGALTWFSLEVVFGTKSGLGGTAPNRDASYVIIVPAHDEAAGIGETLDRLSSQVGADRILMVADNCTDDTAEIAGAKGFPVSERVDTGRRGKGYALAHARQVLSASPPEVVVVIDADCAFERGAPSEIAARAAATGCAIQAQNTQSAAAGSAAPARIGAFAFFVMNVIRSAGLQRLGGSAVLQGTGMALPWNVFAALPLASGNRVEDLALSLHLAKEGIPVLLDDRAAVTSVSPKGASGLDQRRRWEFGFIRTAVTQALPLIAKGLVQRRRSLVTVGLHLLVPPLALLYLVTGTVLVALATAASLKASTGYGPPLLLSLALLVSMLAITATWLVRGRDIVPLSILLMAPLYILWKLPLYLGLTRKPDMEWNRAER